MTDEHWFSNFLDSLSLMAVGAFFMDILPPVALLLSIVWTFIRIYEWVMHRFVRKDPAPFK